MDAYAIRAATLDDLDALTDIYNHYIVNTAIGRSESSTQWAEKFDKFWDVAWFERPLRVNTN